MSGSKWSKKEEEIISNNFATTIWEDLLSILPNKTEAQIIRRADKLGIKRESEVVDVYYDEEKEAWVEKKVTYNGTKFTVRSIIPSPKGTTFEEVQKKLGEKVTKVFAELIVTPRYLELINKLGIKHDEDVYHAYFDMEKELFSTRNEKERKEILDRFEKVIIKLIEEKKQE
jgi:hypothetical protein